LLARRKRCASLNLASASSEPGFDSLQLVRLATEKLPLRGMSASRRMRPSQPSGSRGQRIARQESNSRGDIATEE